MTAATKVHAERGVDIGDLDPSQRPLDADIHHIAEIAGRNATWVAAPAHIQAILPSTLTEEYQRRAGDSCIGTWLHSPGNHLLNGIYRHSNLATNCCYCLACKRFIDFGGTLANALRHGRGQAHEHMLRRGGEDNSESPEARLTDAIALIAFGQLTYKDCKTDNWRRLAGFAYHPERAPGRQKVTELIHEARMSAEEEI